MALLDRIRPLAIQGLVGAFTRAADEAARRRLEELSPALLAAGAERRDGLRCCRSQQTAGSALAIAPEIGGMTSPPWYLVGTVTET